MTDVTWGWLSTQAIASSAGSTPRSAAAARKRSNPRNVLSFTRSEYGSPRRVIREPSGNGRARSYLPVSQPPQSGLNGVNPSPSRAQSGSTSRSASRRSRLYSF